MIAVLENVSFFSRVFASGYLVISYLANWINWNSQENALNILYLYGWKNNETVHNYSHILWNAHKKQEWNKITQVGSKILRSNIANEAY